MTEKKVIDQKEYLKKYLFSGDGDDNKKEKKKKVKSRKRATTGKIIDDDLNLKNIRPMEDNEFDIFINGEDAPLIVGVVDERGLVDFSDKRRWKIMAAAEGGDVTVTSREIKQSKKVQNDFADNLSPPRKEICSNDDLSSPRMSKKQKKKSRMDEDNDLSPPRKTKNYDSFDLSPLCKSKKHKSNNRNESDTDLEKRLREQDREGDPMLEYIKQKQIKEGKRKPDRPTYEGSFMPNRFGIKPGCRWDGVDRSNGYEIKWFDAQNAKVALQEEAYKWSTSDM